MARKLNNNKSGVAADKIPVSPQLYLTLPFAAQKLDESDMGGLGVDLMWCLNPLKLSYAFLLPSLLFEVI